MNKYEMIFIVDAELNEEMTTAAVERVKALIGTEGSVTSEDDWGKRRLAYPINDKNDGHYVYVEFEAPATLPKEIDRVLKINEDIMRFLIIRKEEHKVAKAAEATA